MNLLSLATRILLFAAGISDKDEVSDNRNQILATKHCIHLTKPVSSITYFFDRNKPARVLNPAEIPVVAVEPLWYQQEQLQGILQEVWDPHSADYETFVKLDKIPTPRFKTRSCDDRMHIVRHPRINDNRPMVMKIVEFPDSWQYPQYPLGQRSPSGPSVESPKLNASSDYNNIMFTYNAVTEMWMWMEIRMHQKVDLWANSVGPKFLGLVTERGRGVIGFVSEFVQDAKTILQIWEEAYAAGDLDFQLSDGDRQACLAALDRLHAESLLHGDLHPGNVLRRSDGSVVLIDFESTCHVDSNGRVYGGHETVKEERDFTERWLNLTASKWHQVKQRKAMAEVD
ncbi:Tyrosine kinase catalytic domain protein [Apiospora saccharicola]|uniref:Tyrosine kinase catalytic domain protein n=1 Tax=Apiospora saccharicola TaxID=335842 RepID=A0ABR1TGC5_9PEZI